MQIQLITFGKIAEIIASQTFEVGNISNTDDLKPFLENAFPALSGTKYALAINKKLASANVDFASNATVAIMPPFSGG